MLERISGWFGRQPRSRVFDAIQIEVTSRCLTRCMMCPRVALADRWDERDLPWEIFQRVATVFDRTQHVHLQGWGEPLLHPRLLEMISRAKSAGCRVGITTNGMRLDSDTAERFLDLGLDLVAISIAGAARRTHESIRVGSDFPAIVANTSQLLARRSARGLEHPAVKWSYLMTKTNLEELPNAVDLAASVGVDELYAINLDYLVMPLHDDLKAFGDPLRGRGFDQAVTAARARAQRAGLAFRTYPLHLEEVAACEANPTKCLFVSCDGWVSPCPYLSLAGQESIPRWFEGRRVTVRPPRFGNLSERELAEIWEHPAYRAFRQRFVQRRVEVASRAISVACGSGAADEGLPPPEPCRTCYKLYGV